MSSTVLTFATAYRTHTCGELRGSHVKQEVKLAGAIDRYNEDGSFELRDTYGKTRVKLGEKPVADIASKMNLPETPADKRVSRLSQESVIAVTGTVRARKDADEKSPTGEIWLDAHELDILAPAKTPLIFDPNDEKVSASDRLRHRYMYLRKPALHDNLRFRTALVADLRSFLLEKNFLEVSTPLLSARWTPDQTEAFLSVRARAEVFALQGRRSTVGALLMAGGFDRTFEVGRRFQRRTAYGPFQQPEFSVLEAHLAYVEEQDLVALATQTLLNVGKTTLGESLAPVVKLTAEESWAKYGTDCPDLRYSTEVQDLAKGANPELTPLLRDVLSNNTALLLRVPADRAGKLPGDLNLDKLSAELGEPGAVHRITVSPEAAAVLPEGSKLRKDVADEVVIAARGRSGDVLFVVVGKAPQTASVVAGKLRAVVGKAIGGGRKNAVALVTRHPYFRYEASQLKWVMQGDPLCKPAPGELEGDPHEMHQLGFSIVLNGVKIGSGSVRSHDNDTLRGLFTALGLGPQEVSAQYGHVIDAFRFGVPPHGRIALGIDRLTALLLGLDSLDDVIAMPKAPDGTDGLARSPSGLSKGIVRGLLGH